MGQACGRLTIKGVPSPESARPLDCAAPPAPARPARGSTVGGEESSTEAADRQRQPFSGSSKGHLNDFPN